MHVKCFNCGVVFASKFCPNCGAPAEQSKMALNQNNSNKQIKRKGGCLKVFLVFFLIIFAIGMIQILYGDGEKNTTKTIPISKQSEFQKVTKTTSEQEKNIINILKECGIEKVESIKYEDSLEKINKNNEKTYSVSYNDLSFLFFNLSPDNIVTEVRYGENTLYNGTKVVSTLNDYTFTLNEQSDLQLSCQRAVESILKSPSTAKFPNITKWGFGKEDGKIIVQSYVDSQNSFGADLRSEFQFILSAKDYTIESFIFDGEELMNK